MSADNTEQGHDEEAAPAKSGRSRFIFAFLPLIVFGALAVFFYVQLNSGRNANEVPSVLIGTKAPSLNLPPLEGLKHKGTQVPALTDGEISGKLALVNVFASWCVPCRQEHPLFMSLSRSNEVPIYGINYKDPPDQAAAWLDDLGDPYTRIGADHDGRAGIEWGVYGIPETYVIAANGTIAYRHVGPLTQSDIDNTLLPLVRELQQRHGTE